MDLVDGKAAAPGRGRAAPAVRILPIPRAASSRLRPRSMIRGRSQRPTPAGNPVSSRDAAAQAASASHGARRSGCRWPVRTRMVVPGSLQGWCTEPCGLRIQVPAG